MLTILNRHAKARWCFKNLVSSAFMIARATGRFESIAQAAKALTFASLLWIVLASPCLLQSPCELERAVSHWTLEKAASRLQQGHWMCKFAVEPLRARKGCSKPAMESLGIQKGCFKPAADSLCVRKSCSNLPGQALST